MNLRIASLSLLTCVTLTGCFPKAGLAPGPLSPSLAEAASSRWPEATPVSLEKSRQIFLGTCENCHDYPDMGHIAEEKWPKIMDRMGKKAELTPDESAGVLRFILTARAQGNAKP